MAESTNASHDVPGLRIEEKEAVPNAGFEETGGLRILEGLKGGHLVRPQQAGGREPTTGGHAERTVPVVDETNGTGAGNRGHDSYCSSAR